MTREQAKQIAEVLNAYADGKPFEVKIDGKWKKVHKVRYSFDFENESYRIKKEPKYRPFRTYRECLDEMKKHEPYGYIKQKGYAELYHITPGTGGFLIVSLYEEFTYEQGFWHFTFADGQPFGIKE